MKDKALFTLVRAQLVPLMALDPDLAGVLLAKDFQPRAQGVTRGKAVYFHKVGDHLHGSPRREDVVTGDGMQHVETQKVETTLQFTAWVPQDPKDATGGTESDVLHAVRAIIQSDEVLTAFRAAGVGSLRITDVRNPYLIDDQDRFEAFPSFDVVLTHDRIRTTTQPAVVDYEARISRV